ncbi:hypothetical protein HAX54_047277 [Datura stramonium]|uniref:Uncharacterized protein n=1 Tax=Datura stramonium TaxID=4076 RepID=A0ABS8WI37_DATST|nr:hypothetical protein [Datura stramonium]
METPSAGPSVFNVPMADETPPSTQGKLPSAPSSSPEQFSFTLDPQSSKTPSTTTVPLSSETPKTDNPVETPCENGVDDNDVPLSVKWERLKTVRITSSRKHITVKPSIPKRPRTRGELRQQVEKRVASSGKNK